MPNYLIKCLRYNIILFVLIVMLKINASASEHTSEIAQLPRYFAKRSLFLKEREFLKVKPLSSEMKSFISKYKRSGRSKFDRSKRDNTYGKHMYAIQDGELVPLKHLASAVSNSGNSPSSYTVIPLVLPKSRKPDDKRVRATSCATDDTVEFYSDEEETVKEKETITITTTAGPIYKTTKFNKEPVEKLYINKVMEDVRGLLSHQKEGKVSSREGALCKVIGDWDSDAGGMQFQIENTNNTNPQLPLVKLVEREPELESGFLCDGLWNVTGEVPYNQSSVIILTALSHKRKRLAIFIGECRICEGIETIVGDWMLGRSSRNCKDRQESHSYFADVLRKNNIRLLQKAHLNELAQATQTTGTTVVQTPLIV